MAVTQFRGGPKPFTWSYSRLKNFETCPKRHYHLEVAKDVKEEESEQLLWGNQVHAACAARIAKNTPLPITMTSFEPWCQKILAGADQPGVRILVEQKLAITKEFGPCGFFDAPVWFRAVGDVIKVAGPVALIVDWKTGKIVEDSVQLALAAACVFAHYPEVQKVRSEFIWLKENASTREDFTREGMVELWKGLWPRIESLKHAYETNSYPAKPGRLCRNWCPVKQCPYHGE
ncbi:MAG TPA: PD-(D/E)XK nuclease family protein [Xanthobacteraceae bacterium]|nr:PD-(D/E)XK nuclease family protein [Xanthobacteraceae bacterium]